MKHFLAVSCCLFYAITLTAQSNVPDHHKMVNAVLHANGELQVTAAATSSARDFDFLIGRWNLAHRKLKTRLNNCQEWETFTSIVEDYKGLEGLGNFDIGWATFDGKPWEGRTIRIFNPSTKLWSLYWVDSGRAVMDPPVVGSFKNNIGWFYGKDVYNGIPIIMVFKWDKTNPEAPVWSQAFSTDNGKTWEWNWYNTSTRTK